MNAYRFLLFSYQIRIGLICLLVASSLVIAAPLPEPFSLKQALKLAQVSDQPLLLKAEAERLSAEAALREVNAQNDAYLGLTPRFRLIEPSRVAYDQSHHDSSLGLGLHKRLHDFGRTAAGRRAAQAGIEGQAHRLMAARQERYLLVMQRFFDVLLADLEQARDNEAMAVAYVGLDKARDRVKLKQLSDVTLSDLEKDYELARYRQSASTHRQRATRNALALALNRPDQLSEHLTHGELKGLKRDLPELEKLNDRVLSGNYLIKALRAEVRQTRAQVAEARASGKPLLTGGLNAVLYAQEAGSHHPLSAELQLEIPLFEGDRVKAKTARARAGVLQKQAELQALELALRQRVTELWLELQNLKVKQKTLKSRAVYRELNLDRSRSLYEMEVKADLGDAMVLISQQRLEEAQLRFQAELVWAELDALSGKLLKAER